MTDPNNMTFEQLCELFNYQPKNRPISTKEAAEILDMSFMTLEAYRVRGGGPRFFQPSRRVWYSEVDVLRWLASGAKENAYQTTAA